MIGGVEVRKWAVALALDFVVEACSSNHEVADPDDVERWATRLANFALEGAFDLDEDEDAKDVAVSDARAAEPSVPVKVEDL